MGYEHVLNRTLLYLTYGKIAAKPWSRAEEQK